MSHDDDGLDGLGGHLPPRSRTTRGEVIGLLLGLLGLGLFALLIIYVIVTGI